MMATPLFRLRQLCILLVLLVSLCFLWSSLHIGIDEKVIFEGQQESAREVEDVTVNFVVLHGDKLVNKNETSTRNSKSNEEVQLAQNSMKCNIPRLDINGSEVINFFKTHEPLKCQRENGEESNWVFIDDEGNVRFTDKRKKATCKVRPFRRLNDDRNLFGRAREISDGDNMTGSDFAVVQCVQGFEKWSSLLWTVVVNEKVRTLAKSRGSASKDPSRLNVYFLGFDSLSQMSFRRKMPKTVDFLENVLESVVLNGYNIVGDGTPQAFIPILTGKTEVELPLTRKRYKEANYVDDVYPFIWKNFSDAGYVTLYGEDAFNIGTFTYRLKGFREQPTDHYTRTFFEKVEKLSDRNCIGSTPLHKMWFAYARRFMKSYDDVPKFLLMHQSLLSHDDINLVGVEDDDVASHLQRMHKEGDFENAVVVLMADHGHRFAKLRETHQGQLEERLPFFSIALPKKFRQTPVGTSMHSNLVANRDRLSSPFDIHATLLDVLNLPTDEKVNEMQSLSVRSLSLFRPIPDDRTCTQAGVEPHWCVCLDWQDATSDDEDRRLSRRLAQAVVRAINGETEPERRLCAPLVLAEFIYAKKLIPNRGVLAYKNVKDADGFVPDLTGNTRPAFAHFQLKLRTTPGDAIYEVTLFYEYAPRTARIDLSSISHVNKFGDRPHCIIDKNYFLATFCVCHDRV